MQKVLFVSHTHTFGPFRVGSHHLAREFARQGIEVTHLSTPQSLPHTLLNRDRTRGQIARRAPIVDEDGVAHLVPRAVLPAGLPPRRVGLNRTAKFDAILIDQPLLWTRRFRSMTNLLVYRPTDEYTDPLKRRLQRDVLRHADAVVATSQRVLDSLGSPTPPSIVLPNGVEFDRFESPERAPRPRRAVYVGAIDNRYDDAAVMSLARAFADWEFVITGRVHANDSPRNLASIPFIPYEDVPAFLSSARIGLLPLSDDPANLGRSPMKLYEYLAAGLSVLSRETPSISNSSDQGIFTYPDAADLSSAFGAAAASPSPNGAGIHLARSMSWAARSRELLQFLHEVGTR